MSKTIMISLDGIWFRERKRGETRDADAMSSVALQGFSRSACLPLQAQGEPLERHAARSKT